MVWVIVTATQTDYGQCSNVAGEAPGVPATPTIACLKVMECADEHGSWCL